MALSRPRILAAAAFLLLLLTATGSEMKVAEARTCVSQSQNFRGECLSSTNCASVCKTENFPDGDCKTRGLERKCFCIKEDC
ncbi:hypothetical protein QYE76_023825 [Lolium multiflorum]|uniref:Knottins-like domain-containing protein n=1 Tax=Lolium multiflorum TaxID=4521 RepID=A0AAD8RAZ7_LOLMU|nr:hypothetical protein QYE76_023825 [Lolium multiflorum]